MRSAWLDRYFEDIRSIEQPPRVQRQGSAQACGGGGWKLGRTVFNSWVLTISSPLTVEKAGAAS